MVGTRQNKYFFSKILVGSCMAFILISNNDGSRVLLVFLETLFTKDEMVQNYILSHTMALMLFLFL